MVLPLQFDCGYMEDGGPLQIAGFARRWCQIPRRCTCPTWLLEQPSGCVTWCMNAFVFTETKKEFFSCCWTKWQKNVVLYDKTGKFYDKYHRHRAIRARALWRKPSPHCSRISGSSQRRNPVFRCDDTCTDAAVDNQTRSVDSHTIQCEKRDTHDSVRVDSWTEVQERDPATG